MTLTEALAKLHRAGRVRSQWRPGMLITGYRGDGPQRVLDRHLEPAGPAYRHDLADAATVGCLLALLREASWDASLAALRNRSREHGRGGARSWGVVSCDGAHPTLESAAYPSEGEAIEAAIIALAETL